MNYTTAIRPPTPRQRALLELLRGLSDGELRRLRITCRGTEPWEITMDIESTVSGLLKPGAEDRKTSCLERRP